MHIELSVVQVVTIFYMASMKWAVLFEDSSTTIKTASIHTQIILAENSTTERLSSNFFQFYIVLEFFIIFKMFNHKKRK